jgi:hypothetical protein
MELQRAKRARQAARTLLRWENLIQHFVFLHFAIYIVIGEGGKVSQNNGSLKNEA